MKGFNLFSKEVGMVEVSAYVGTACMLFAPYLLSYLTGFILAAIGVALITPQVIVNKQYNLVLLNCVSFVGYVLQILNVL